MVFIIATLIISKKFSRPGLLKGRKKIMKKSINYAKNRKWPLFFITAFITVFMVVLKCN